VSAHATANSSSEQNLITQARNGDASAFAVLYETHKPRIVAVCLRMTKDMAEAEDLTQDAFIYVFRKFSTFRGDSAFSTWLHRVAVNTVLMHFRKRGRRQAHLEYSNPQDARGFRREYGRVDERLARCADRLALIWETDLKDGIRREGPSPPRLLVRRLDLRRKKATAELATACGGRAVALDAFLAAPGHVDVIVTATSAREPLLGTAFFTALPGTPPLVIDLAVPRDTDGKAAAAAGAQLFDIDHLKAEAERNRHAREAEIAEARVVIDEALEALRRRVVERDLSPIVRDLRDQGQAAADELLKQLFNNGLAKLDEAHRDHIRRFGQQVVNQLLHLPSVGLKRLAQDHGMEAVEAFLQGVRDDRRGQ